MPRIFLRKRRISASQRNIRVQKNPRNMPSMKKKAIAETSRNSVLTVVMALAIIATGGKS
jgi:hypothetical protein